MTKRAATLSVLAAVACTLGAQSVKLSPQMHYWTDELRAYQEGELLSSPFDEGLAAGNRLRNQRDANVRGVLHRLVRVVDGTEVNNGVPVSEYGDERFENYTYETPQTRLDSIYDDETGEVFAKYRSVYDEAGRLAESSWQFSNGNNGRIVYRYDPGRLATFAQEWDDTELRLTLERVWNSQGLLLSSIWMPSDSARLNGDQRYSSAWRYDNQGNVLEASLTIDTKLTSTDRFTYEGNSSTRVTRGPDGTVSKSYTVTFDGDKVTRETLNELLTTYQYDASGHLVLCVYPIGRLVYSYDPQGRLRTKRDEDREGKAFSETEYRYSWPAVTVAIERREGSMHYKKSIESSEGGLFREYGVYVESSNSFVPQQRIYKDVIQW